MKRYILVLLVLVAFLLPTPTQAVQKDRMPRGIPQVYYVYTPQATYIHWMNYRPGVRTVYRVFYVCIKKHCKTFYFVMWRKYVPYGPVRVVDRQKTNNYQIR